MTRLLRYYAREYMRIYGLDVKDRTRTEGRPKRARNRAHTSTAHGRGASVRTRIASVTLAYDKVKIRKQKRIIIDSLKYMNIR